MQHVKRRTEENKQTSFTQRRTESYGEQPPLCVLSEIFTFRMLSVFFSDLKTQDQKVLSRELFATTYKNAANRIHCCSVLRNICAHYERLYFRAFSLVPAGIHCEEGAKRRLCSQLLCVKSLHPDKQRWNACVAEKIKGLSLSTTAAWNLLPQASRKAGRI